MKMSTAQHFVHSVHLFQSNLGEEAHLRNGEIWLRFHFLNEFLPVQESKAQGQPQYCTVLQQTLNLKSLVSWGFKVPGSDSVQGRSPPALHSPLLEGSRSFAFPVSVSHQPQRKGPSFLLTKMNGDILTNDARKNSSLPPGKSWQLSFIFVWIEKIKCYCL